MPRVTTPAQPSPSPALPLRELLGLVLAFGGVVSLTTAAFLLHPLLGMALLSVCAILVGLTLATGEV